MTEQTEPMEQSEPVEPIGHPARTAEPVQAADAVQTEPVASLPPAADAGVSAGPGASAAPGDLPPLLPPPPPEAPAPKKDRRALRAVLRWTAAVAVFAVAGAGTAYGITRMERTDVPGLRTESDGRWDYPAIVRPPLPAGSPAPFADVNKAGAHYADLRKLLLPAPGGAKADAALRGTDGWLVTKTFLAQYSAKTDRDAVAQLLTDYGLRHIAARGWTMPDGTRTRIYLLQFNTAAVADEVVSMELTKYSSPTFPVRGAATSERDEDFPQSATVDDVANFVYTESKPYGAEQVRQAYLSAGDVVALIVQSRKGTAPTVPFQQTVTLQSQLLD
ncbi:hypothetical protein AB0I54_37420 [Streptomyces sp. NPDC050625]|uniref:hypothetical protein n=1 Tax=Streptomyces sp. NPDC050625 TaxID=3154629 RepID=UPI003416C273